MMEIFKAERLGVFAGGVLFGTAGVKLLSRHIYKNALKHTKKCRFTEQQAQLIS